MCQCKSIDNKDDEKNSMYIWLIKTTLYNFLDKLRSESGQEDDFTANKWTWFDIQICITFLLSRVISQTLLDFTKIGRVIGYLIDTVQPPSVSGIDSNGTLTSSIYISFAVYLESSNHIGMCNLVDGSMLCLLSKQKRSGKVSLKTRLIGVGNKITLDMLMKKFYIAIK